MKIKLAATLGYCLGVKRAMNMAFRHLSRRGEKVYSHGELIHNNPALSLLEAKGLKIWRGEGEGVVIIRAHGLPPDEMEKLSRTPLKIEDATCPRVLAIHKLVAREAEKGRDVIIWGGAGHPEVAGIVGHARGRGRVVENAAELGGLPPLTRPLLVSQTTQDLEKWPEIEAAARARWPEATICNTICPATARRQSDVRALAEEADALLIIGGKTSGNTARLADVGRRFGLAVFLAETAEDLKAADFQDVKILGVAAGASTSNWQIGQILEAVRTMTRPRGGFFSRLLRTLALSNIYAAIGLAALSQCAAILMGLSVTPFIFSFFFFQTLSLYLFRDFTLGQTVKFNAPDRRYFMEKYKKPLLFMGALSFSTAAFGAAMEGGRLPLIMALMWLFAFIYQFLPRPRGYADWNLARLILRPSFLALGWGAAILWAAAPLSFLAARLPAAVFSLGAVSGHVFVLSIMEDVRGAQGDQIFGRPSLPLFWDEAQTKRALGIFLTAWMFWLVIGAASRALPLMAILMAFSGPLYGYKLLKPLFLHPYGYMFEAAMYGQLLLNLFWVLLWTL